MGLNCYLRRFLPIVAKQNVENIQDHAAGYLQGSSNSVYILIDLGIYRLQIYLDFVLEALHMAIFMLSKSKF
jgi:hypothetical protein